MQETAAKLRVTRGAIYANVARGAFPKPAHIGGRVMFDRAEVDAWLAAQFAARGDVASAQRAARRA